MLQREPSNFYRNVSAIRLQIRERVNDDILFIPLHLEKGSALSKLKAFGDNKVKVT